MRTKLIKRIAAALASAVMLSSAVPVSAEGPIVTGDLNGDGVVNISDAIMLSSYLLGRAQFTREQFALSDLNSDGSADCLDLVVMKFIVIANSGRLPTGTWVASDGRANRYFWFGGEEGSITDEETGTEQRFAVSMDGDTLSFDIAGKTATAKLSWLGSRTFNVTWGDGSMETMRWYSGEPIVYGDLLSGEWIGSGASKRIYSIKGVNGSCLDTETNVGTSFWYEKDGNELTLHQGGTSDTDHAVITPVDSMHIDLAWDDGYTERLTKHDIEVRDGITYVNGILIANKTYDLPSTYNPNGILPEAQAAFDKMKADAWSTAGLKLDICSGFRSYTYQRDLYNSYVNRDGKAKADTYSARPGHSEHQTGLAMDINWAGDAFNNTPEAKWIAAHCAEYGFILRYPQGKQDITGYKYESWHVRYLGLPLAKEVTDSGLTLEEFLCIDSVYKY